VTHRGVVDNLVVNRLRIALSLAVVLGLAGVVAAAAPATAARPSGITKLDHVGTTFFRVHGMWMRSTTGERVFVSVFVDRYSWGRGPDLNDVQVDMGKGDENHLWFFDDLAQKDFAFSLKRGVGSLRAGSAVLGRFGRMQLQLKRRGATKLTACGAGVASAVTPVTVTGRFRFTTHSTGAHPWGSFGRTGKVIRFRGFNHVTTEYGNPNNSCFTPPEPCASDAGWSGPAGVHGVLSGDSYIDKGKRHGEIVGFDDRSVRGADADRTDFVFHRLPVPDVVQSDAGASVAVASHGQRGVTGAASMTSVGSPKALTQKCAGGTLSGQVWHASYTNGVTPLTLSEDIGGGFTHRDSAASADIFVESVSSQPASARPPGLVTAGPLAAREHLIRLTTLAQWRARG
jgi:hypothetical protein